MDKEKRTAKQLVKEWKEDFKEDWYAFSNLHPVIARALHGTVMIYIANLAFLGLLKMADMHIEVVSNDD